LWGTFDHAQVREKFPKFLCAARVHRAEILAALPKPAAAFQWHGQEVLLQFASAYHALAGVRKPALAMAMHGSAFMNEPRITLKTYQQLSTI
jgi:hypothetical protein